MRGLSSANDAGYAGYAEMNIPLTATDSHRYGRIDSNDSNASLSSRYPSETASAPPYATSPLRPASAKVHKAPTALSSFLARFTGSSAANQEGIRIIHLNNAERNAQAKYLHNRISTSKYNYFTFLPKFLYEQFSKYANIFFLFTACIQ
ncbi:hypothetical protein EC968_000263, partial [Mortierella alpina]